MSEVIRTGYYTPSTEYNIGNYSYQQRFSEGSGTITIPAYTIGVKVTVTYVVQMSQFRTNVVRANVDLYGDDNKTYSGSLYATTAYMNSALNRFTAAIPINIDNTTSKPIVLDAFNLYLDSFSIPPSSTQKYTLSITAIQWECKYDDDDAFKYRQGLLRAPASLSWGVAGNSVTVAPSSTNTLTWDPAIAGENNNILYYSVYARLGTAGDGVLLDPSNNGGKIYSTALSISATQNPNETWFYRISATLAHSPNPSIDFDGTDWSAISPYSGWDASLSTVVGDLSKSTLRVPSVALNRSSVEVSWTAIDNVTNNTVDHYELWTKSPTDVDFSQLKVISDRTATSTTITAPGVLGSHQYKLKTIGSRGSSESDAVSMLVYANPEKPKNVTISPTETSINGIATITWNPPDSDNSLGFNRIVGFNVLSASSSSGPWATKENGESLIQYDSLKSQYSFEVVASSEAKTYRYFIVKAVGEIQNTESPNSNYVQLLAKSISKVVAPAEIHASKSILSQGDSAELSWSNAASSDDNKIIGYQIYRSINDPSSGYVPLADGKITVDPGTTYGSAPIKSAADATPGDTYYYKVMSLASGGSQYNSDRSVRTASVRINSIPSAPLENSVSPTTYTSGDITLAFTHSTDADVNFGQKIIYYAEYKISTSSEWKQFGSQDELNDSSAQVTIVSSRPGSDPEVVDGSIIQFRVRAVDDLGGSSPYTQFTRTVTKSGSGTVDTDAPIQILNGNSTYSGTPYILIKNISGAEITISSSDPSFGSQRTISVGQEFCYKASRTSTAFSVHNNSTGTDTVVSYNYTRLSSTFSDDPIIPKVTHVKAAHIEQMRDRTDVVRKFYGLSEFNWSGEVKSKETSLRFWTTHMLELREALSDVIRKINSYTGGGSLSKTWIQIPKNTPRADVMTEIRDMIKTL